MVRRIASCRSCQRRYCKNTLSPSDICSSCKSVVESKDPSLESTATTENNDNSTASDTAQKSKNETSNNSSPVVCAGEKDNQSLQSKNDNICLICGSSLEHLPSMKSRLAHIKRCSKKHGVSARSMKENQDEEDFITKDENDSTPIRNALPVKRLNEVEASNPYQQSSKADWHGDASAQPQQQASLTKFFPAPIKSVNNVLLAGAKRMAKTAQIQKKNNDKKRKRPHFHPRISTKACPSYKRIPGTDFVCDGFVYAKSSLTTNYFLTHFHSDHYGGITSKWNAGVIYCSLPTANLVHSQLGVEKRFLHPLQLDTPTVIESNQRPVIVTLMDANHCPGAVMFLFEVGKRRILHVGDFRWNANIMLKNAALRIFVDGSETRLDELFLDTTYCNEKYTLPTQQEAIQAATEIAEKELLNPKDKVLLLFGAYTIGKERIYLSIAQHLRTKVYVDQRRHRILSSLNWSRDQMSLLTTNKTETNLWVVPLGHINFKKMEEYYPCSNKVFDRKTFDRIVGFRPTGWSHTGNSNKNGIVQTRRSGNMTVHGVPYSEHSSFPELVDCIACLKPKKIVPTVSASKSEEQVDLLTRGLRQREKLLQQQAMYQRAT